MSKPRTPKPSYILSKSGKDKLEKSVKDKSDTIIGDKTVMDRETIANIRNGSKGVNKNSLERLFNNLGIKLEEEDYEECNRSRKDDFSPDEIKTEKLKNVLGELNYSQQKFVFNETISRIKPAGTFLIHGKTDYGQRWLVNLLRYKVPYHTEAWQKSIYIKLHRKDIQTLWENLAEELETSPSPEAVIEQLYQRWKNSTIILAIHNVDLMAGSLLKQFMNELWQPLVNKANHEKTQKTFRLVLFLVDNKNSKSKLETSLSLVTEADKNKPHIPLALPELEPFNQDIIESWVGVHQLLSQLWKSSESIEQVMREIVERDNQPISVLSDICQCFELDWEQHIVRGLAL